MKNIDWTEDWYEEDEEDENIPTIELSMDSISLPTIVCDSYNEATGRTGRSGSVTHTRIRKRRPKYNTRGKEIFRSKYVKNTRIKLRRR